MTRCRSFENGSIAMHFWPALLWTGALGVVLALRLLKQAPVGGAADLGWAAVSACLLSALAFIPAATLAAVLGRWWRRDFSQRCGVLSLAMFVALAALMILQA